MQDGLAVTGVDWDLGDSNDHVEDLPEGEAGSVPPPRRYFAV